MPTLPRYLRFNLVGALGALVQLTTLALLNHQLPHHILLTSTLALELTLLHNLTWHLHYTWPDRTNPTTRLQQITRFHLANGLVSLLGNLAQMHLLVTTLHLPAVPANALAILLCSLLNYSLGNRWVFATAPQRCEDNYSQYPIRKSSSLRLRLSRKISPSAPMPTLKGTATSSPNTTVRQEPKHHPKTTQAPT